jgi:hypothetical protein
MKLALAIATLVIGALWALFAFELLLDWYGCDWGIQDRCGPDDGWLALILGVPVATSGVVIVPASFLSLFYVLRRSMGRS